MSYMEAHQKVVAEITAKSDVRLSQEEKIALMERDKNKNYPICFVCKKDNVQLFNLDIVPFILLKCPDCSSVTIRPEDLKQ